MTSVPISRANCTRSAMPPFQEVEPEPDDFVSDTETEVEEPEIAELTLPTFAALEDESEIVTPELDVDNADSGVEEDSQIAMEVE